MNSNEEKIKKYNLTIEELTSLIHNTSFDGEISEFRVKQELDLLLNVCCDKPDIFTSYFMTGKSLYCSNCDKSKNVNYYEESI